MRIFAIVLLACVTACGSSTKPAARAEPRVPQTEVRAELGGWRTSFRIGPDWRLDPKNQSKDALVLDAVGKSGLALALILEAAAPGTKAGDVAAKWQGHVILAGAYKIKSIGTVIATSDEDAAFSVSGVDQGVAVTTTGIVHLVSSNGIDTWAISLIYGPSAYTVYATQEAHRIVRSFRLQPLK